MIALDQAPSQKLFNETDWQSLLGSCANSLQVFRVVHRKTEIFHQKIELSSNLTPPSLYDKAHAANPN